MNENKQQNTASTESLADRIEKDFLPFVRHPGRYIGGEVNQIKKKLSACDLTFALCFPDIYEIGMSHTGLAIVYEVLNRLDAVAAERCFSLWPDAEEIAREKGIPLFSLESKTPLKNFDIIGFSLTNELCYTNVLNVLNLSGLKLRSADRLDSDPIILGGAGMTNCAEPIADFFDIFVLGQAEEAMVDFVEHFKDCKKQKLSKQQTLITAAEKFDFVYVPSLYEIQYDGDKIKSFKAKYDNLPTRFENAFVKDLDNSVVPQKPIVPFVEPVHERISIEVMRGCPGRCRFCQASFCRRPLRYRSADKILEIAKAAYKATAFDTVGLLSLSTADYPYLEELIEKLRDYFEPKHVGVSLPSLRVDKQLKLLPKLSSSVRKGGLTIAVEAASEKLRRIINKPISNEDLFAAIEQAYKAGFSKVKLYFMVGFPEETTQDIQDIVDLSWEIAKLGKKISNRMVSVNVAVSWLVPKAHTPFGWLGQKSAEYFRNAKELILKQKKLLRANAVNFKFHDIEQSVLEAAIGRGDRRLTNVIEYAFNHGAKFDLWSEHFNLALWEDAFEKCGMNLDSLAQRNFDTNEILPWQHLGGPQKKYLLKHFNKAISIY